MIDEDTSLWDARASALARTRAALGLGSDFSRLTDDLPYAVLGLDAHGEVVFQNAYAARHLDGRLPDSPLAVSATDARGCVVVWALEEDAAGEVMEDAAALMAMLTHDMGAPLRAISQVAGWLVEDVGGEELDPEIRRHLGLLDDRARRLQRMHQDLLEFARAGYTSEAWERVDMLELCRSIAPMLDSAAAFELRVTGAPLVLHTAAVPLQHVVHNLLSNAIRHHDMGRGVIDVSVEEVDEARVRVRIADDGLGIAQKDRSRAMKLMTTLRSRDRGAGSGVGLALVRKLVTELGGTVSLESNHPRGLVCSFTWPRGIVHGG
ncbi:MAG: HAMP domain-containing sensor histidine kinase [Myxococcota bacterium]